MKKKKTNKHISHSYITMQFAKYCSYNITGMLQFAVSTLRSSQHFRNSRSLHYFNNNVTDILTHLQCLREWIKVNKQVERLRNVFRKDINVNREQFKSGLMIELFVQAAALSTSFKRRHTSAIFDLLITSVREMSGDVPYFNFNS